MSWIVEKSVKELLQMKPLLSVCLLTALCTGSSGGQWEDLYWPDGVHWEETLWGERADQSSGEDWTESGWRAPEETGAGDCWSEEERRWAGAAFTLRGSHPFPPGNITDSDHLQCVSLFPLEVLWVSPHWSLFQLFKVPSPGESPPACFFISLQGFQSLSAPPQSADLPRITISPQFSMEELKKVVTGVMERVEPEIVKLSGGRMNNV